MISSTSESINVTNSWLSINYNLFNLDEKMSKKKKKKKKKKNRGWYQSLLSSHKLVNNYKSLVKKTPLNKSIQYDTYMIYVMDVVELFFSKKKSKLFDICQF